MKAGEDHRFRIAQKVFIRNAEGKVLIVRFSSTTNTPASLRGLWDFPGGGLEYQEGLRDGLLREIQEELGNVSITVGKPLVAWTFVMQEEPTYCVVIGYDATWVNGDVRLNAEHDQFQWVEPNALMQYAFDPSATQAVKEYVALHKGSV